jgi:hypothetical protein
MFAGNENEFTLSFDDCPKLTIEYNEQNHLPIGYATTGKLQQLAVIPRQTSYFLMRKIRI